MAGSTYRRAGALIAAGAMALSLGTAGAAGPPAHSAVDREAQSAADRCASSAPIPAADLASGVETATCSLVGRVVVSGDAAVVVPPDGYGVGADGVSMAGRPGTASLEVSNRGGVVRASTEGGLSGQRSAPAARAAGACSDGAYSLESGGHPWGQTLKWRLHLASTPSRFPRAKAQAEIKAGMTNIRSGRNSCGLKAKLHNSSKYLGNSAAGPGIKVSGSRVRCGSFNRSNIVGWGALPNGLLGWTCYWWGGNNKMIGTDMRLSNSSKVVLGFPAACSNKYDLQSLATHEWGHSWGLGHVQNPNLTMHHFLPPCSGALRTLGLGDFRGMRKLYG